MFNSRYYWRYRKVSVRVWHAGLLFLLCSNACVSAEDVLHVNYSEPVKHFFADQEVELQLHISSTVAIKVQVAWSLQMANRTLKQQTEELELTPEKPVTLEIKHHMPPLKEGVTFPIELLVRVNTAKPELFTTFKQTLYLHYRDDWRLGWEKRQHNFLNLHIFDPPGRTIKLFGDSESVYERVTNLETLRELKEGVILIGENTDWSEHGELGELLLEAAQRDITVICLAPAVSDAVLPLAQVENKSSRWNLLKAAGAVEYANRHPLTDLLATEKNNKSLNHHWRLGKSCQIRGLQLVTSGEQLVARTVDEEQGWPWLEIQFDKPHQKFIWCGLSIVQDWEESPCPRELLGKMLMQHLMDRTPPNHAKPFLGYPAP